VLDPQREDIHQAVASFLEANPSWNGKKPARFIRKAVQRAEELHTFLPGKSPGPNCKLPVEEVKRGRDALLAGYFNEGHQRYYTSIVKACESNPTLAAICKQYDVSPRTLLHHMRKIDCTCYRRRMVIKRKLTIPTKLLRTHSCKSLKKWSVRRLRHTFWIDAATIWLHPKARLVYAPADAELVESDERAPANSKQLRKLKFYICINAIVGPVALVFITGTTGMEKEVQWTVRGRAVRVG
jgi:hypothetical protein